MNSKSYEAFSDMYLKKFFALQYNSCYTIKGSNTINITSWMNKDDMISIERFFEEIFIDGDWTQDMHE